MHTPKADDGICDRGAEHVLILVEIEEVRSEIVDLSNQTKNH
jgi:hypothetical protein